MAHPSQTIPGEGRATVADKLGAAVSLGECLSAVMASMLDHKAILTTEEQATLATIGANVEMRVRDLCDFLTTWTGEVRWEPGQPLPDAFQLPLPTPRKEELAARAGQSRMRTCFTCGFEGLNSDYERAVSCPRCDATWY